MRRAALLAATLAAQFLATSVLGSPTPTPSPSSGARKKKLSGGSFGTNPAPTPVGEASPESLAGVARRAQEQSSTSGSHPPRKIVITNETIGKAEPVAAGTSISITGGSGSKPVVKAPPTPAAAQPGQSGSLPPYRDASGRTEAEWRVRVDAVRKQIDATQAALDAANAESRRLENDFYAWSDGNYREKVIRPAWDQAKERAKTLEDDLEKAKTGLSDLEEEARKSGTPPGWLR